MLSNLRLFAVVAASFGFQMAILYLPPLQTIFGTVTPTFTHVMRWLVLAARGVSGRR